MTETSLREMKRYFRWFVILTALTGAALICCVRGRETELGVRTAFFRAVTENGDLNVVNQVSPQERWLVTRRYNYPTHLGTGVVAFWFPFYEYIRIFFPSGAFDRALIFELKGCEVAGIVRNVFFLVLSCFLMIRFLRVRSWLLLGAVLLATPIPWFAAFEPSRIEITGLAIATVLTVALLECLENPPEPRRYFALGLAIGISAATVSAFSIYALPILICLAIRKEGRVPSLVSCILGFAIPFGLNCINTGLQKGVFWPTTYSTIARIVNHSSKSMLLRALFFHNGWMVTSPIFLLLYLATIVLLVRRSRLRSDLARAATSVIPIAFMAAMILVFRRTISYSEQISSRNLVYVFPILLCSSAEIAEPFLRRKPFQFGVLLSVVAAVNWGSLAQYWVNGIVLQYFPTFQVLHEFWTTVSGTLLEHASHVTELGKLVLLFPLIAPLACVLWYLDRGPRSGRQPRSEWLWAGSAVLLTAGYAVVTSLNIAHNQQNVAKFMNDGVFDNSVVSGGPELDNYDEVTSIFENGIDYLPPELANEADRTRDVYLSRAMSEIVVDPIGFKWAWENGCIRFSIWNSGRGKCARRSPPEK